ncbi:hydrolase [Legionella tunisiensis]|uniref:hydrolase n=1 Tax=Legionella tunisiensis TaxID=1034944 RepID=UPI0002F07F98|nr:hydrolase [Legionella tunisiensis]
MLLEKETSCVVLIDVQEKLTPFVQEAEALVARCQWVIHLAKELGIPLLVSEQYPSGLGVTVEPLHSLIAEGECFEKVHFSCFRQPTFKQSLKALNKKQLVLIGIEAHVCVLQSAMEMKAAGYEVYIVVDAISSRSQLDYNYGLRRMEQAGIHLVTSEMVFFEWVGQAGTPQFKALSKAYLQQKDKQ